MAARPPPARLETGSALVEPRAALRLDGDALLAYLRRAVPALAAEPGPLRVRAFSHGQSNPTYLVEAPGSGLRVVLRKKPPGRLLASAHAVEREHRVLAALAAGGAVPVPRPLALCEDTSVLGTPFYVMEFAPGAVFTDPRMPGATPAARAAAYGALADTLAALHAVDPAAAGLAAFGDPRGYCARQVARWGRQYRASLPGPPPPPVARLAAWLAANVPPEDATPPRPAIVHGDYRLDNLVFDEGGSGMRVRAVLDWELCTLGNPWADVAYACLAYHMPPQLPMMHLGAPLPEGVPCEADLLARYCAARGVAAPPPREWAFYLALSLFRLLAILAGVQARAHQGNASSAAAAAISSDDVLDALAAAALAIINAADGATAGGGGSVASGGASSSPAAAAAPPAPLQAAPSLGAPSARAADLLQRVRAFVAQHVLPAEAALNAHATGPQRWTIHPLAEGLKARAKAAGLWNLWLPAGLAARLTHLLPEVPEAERALLLGAGLSNLDYAHVCAAMGTSVWAPEAFNCSAPDTGNMEVLAKYGTPAQQRRWLVPLLRGEIRSCFAMTEKAVASSDATNITASIARHAGGYVLSGVKWWTSGAMDPRCKVAVFMGKTDPTAPAHRQQSMILVPMDAPGVKVVRPLTVYGYDDAPHGHAEVHFEGVVVPADNLLLGEGRGFEIAQGRLGPGRLHHCMRLVGAAERGLDLMAQRALARVAFGRPLAAQGGVREKLARCRVALEGARLLVLSAAHALDEVGHKAAAGQIAAAKVVAPAVALEVLDAAIQVHGGAGVCQDTPLAHLWAAARTLRIADGPDEVHLGTLAKLELKRAAAAAAAVPADAGAGGRGSTTSVPRHRM